MLKAIGRLNTVSFLHLQKATCKKFVDANLRRDSRTFFGLWRWICNRVASQSRRPDNVARCPAFKLTPTAVSLALLNARARHPGGHDLGRGHAHLRGHS